MAPKKKTPCEVPDCPDRAAMIIGDCSGCKMKFCGAHRLPELHKCSALQEFKKKSWDKNAKTLEKFS
tara:strand:+ start:691 stop:891 length:201 start_codon:yes stop_codon:yes gene_type:complete